jgi:hypothetical protein
MMSFVPIPTMPDHLFAWREHWYPFLDSVSRLTKEPIPVLMNALIAGQVQIALAWDGKKAHAIVGIQYRQSGDDVAAELIWLTGINMKAWDEQLLADLHRFLKDIGCTISRPICRPGWSRLLKRHGYKTTRYVMEHRL